MPRPEPATLGDASLDQLRELREASERRMAVGRRGVVELPIEEVHPDPDQVRRDFAGDVVAEDDAEGLKSLAANIAAVGIHNPIHVRLHPEGGYVIISGERRWRAAGLAGLEVVPCLVDEDGDSAPTRLVQLAENLQRSDLKLLDTARALGRCLEESGLQQAELAKALGRSKSWVSKHLALLRAEGPLAEALDENRLGNLESARRFVRLPARDQERLLRRARKEGAPVSHAELARLDRRRAKAAAGDSAPAESSPAEETPPAAALEDAPGDDARVLRLTIHQLRDLVRRLGGDEDARPLEEELFRLLAA